MTVSAAFRCALFSLSTLFILIISVPLLIFSSGPELKVYLLKTFDSVSKGDDHEVLIFLSLPLECCECRHEPHA